MIISDLFNDRSKFKKEEEENFTRSNLIYSFETKHRRITNLTLPFIRRITRFD